MIKVHCQNEGCGRDITDGGGDISSSGRIFCHGYKDDRQSRCLDYEIILMTRGEIPETLFYNYHNRRKVQRAIRKGELTKFGSLEQKTP